MIRHLAIVLALLLAPTELLAQGADDSKAESRREAHPFSMNGGIGFLADVNSSGGKEQFLMQFDFLYHPNDNFGAGVTLQAGPSSNSSTVAMSFEGRFYLPLDGRTTNEFAARLAPYLGAGIGFRTYTEDRPFERGTTDFLFSPALGLEYDISDHVSLTTDMRFNVTSGRDNFYYSWQLLGARYRF